MFSRVPTDFNPDSTYINYPVIPQESSSLKCNTVSIHALVRVRHQGLREPCPLLRFNPRTRESATLKWNGYVVALHVSIHALVRVRRKCQTSPARIHGFNPRTRESATVQQVVAQPHAVVSIHALVRVRPMRTNTKTAAIWFQSTHS